MADALALIAKHLEGKPKKPPIHLWHPELSGDIAIVIKANGDWYHEGGLIKRKPLVKLFASILRKEADGEYYLVTPVEKWRIVVEDAPFIILDMDVINPSDPSQQVIFTSNVDDKYLLGKGCKLSVAVDPATGEPNPKLLIENGLSARLSRNVFYRLSDYLVEQEGQLKILSDGGYFELGKA